MISSRYVGALNVLCALALVPVTIHSYVGLLVDDGVKTGALSFDVPAFTSRPGAADQPWADVFASPDWIERRFDGPDGNVRLTVIRTFDAKRAYHHPELAVAHGVGYSSHAVEALDGVTLHVLRGGPGGPTAVYALHYDRGFIDDPVAFQVRSVLTQLVGGRRAMTLVFARDMVPLADRPLASWPSARVAVAIAAQLPR